MTDAGVTDPTPADLHFYFDPVCPFAWMTSKWVRLVAEQRTYDVDWRFISLRLLNSHIDYDAHFPPEYEASHTAGLRLLRVAARARAEHGGRGGRPVVRRAGRAGLRGAAGLRRRPVPGSPAGCSTRRSTRRGCRGRSRRPTTTTGGTPTIQAETDEALRLTGKDVGTPILHFQPPGGVAFFGPVISRLPSPEQAAELWDHVVGLASFAGFAELKRSLRELPQLRALGVREDEVGVQEDWHGGSRRQKR